MKNRDRERASSPFVFEHSHCRSIRMLLFGVYVCVSASVGCFSSASHLPAACLCVCTRMSVSVCVCVWMWHSAHTAYSS